MGTVAMSVGGATPVLLLLRGCECNGDERSGDMARPSCSPFAISVMTRVNAAVTCGRRLGMQLNRDITSAIDAFGELDSQLEIGARDNPPGFPSSSLLL
jgi:hypothetical protein